MLTTANNLPLKVKNEKKTVHTHTSEIRGSKDHFKVVLLEKINLKILI